MKANPGAHKGNNAYEGRHVVFDETFYIGWLGAWDLVQLADRKAGWYWTRAVLFQSREPTDFHGPFSASLHAYRDGRETLKQG